MSIALGILFAIGVLIGVVLGLTGAGGSAFAVPLLILVGGLSVTDAIGIALGAVAASAVSGAFYHWKSGSIQWIPVLILGSTGLLVAPLGRLAGEQFPAAWLLAGFSTLAIIVAVRMWRQAQQSPESVTVVRSSRIDPGTFNSPVCRMSQSGHFEWKFRCVSALVFGGLAVGLLTGLFGVGGGFLIVPLMLYLSQVSMQQAVGTSLVIITVVSSSGFVSYAASNPSLDWPVILTICAGGITGMLLGHLISARVAGPQLQKFFAVALIAVALVTLARQLL